MAKGDSERARNEMTYQTNLSQNNLNNLRNIGVGQNQTFWNNYLGAVDQNKQDYGNIMGQYQDFAKTGGYSASDVENMRARALSPTRAIYANAQNDINRQRRIQGGYAPNYIAAKAKMARELSSGLSDANTNVEAQLAEMVNQGKRFGVEGSRGLYGTTPGMSNMFGQQALTSTGQLADIQGLQNQLSLGRMNAQINSAQIPGNTDIALNRIGQIGRIGAGLFGTFGGGGAPSTGWTVPSNQRAPL